MNPFDEIEENTTTILTSKVELWVEEFGRKRSTYVSGWNISEDELKTHLKNIKKKNGCNGTVKQDSESKQYTLLLQGDHTDYLIKYLQDNGVQYTDIIIRG